MQATTNNYETLHQIGAYAQRGLNYAGTKAAEMFEEAKKPGTTQNIVYAAGRTIVGIASIHHAPYTAVAAGIAGDVAPTLANSVCSVADGIITGVWDKAPHMVRVGLPVIGIGVAIYTDWQDTIFSTLGVIFAAKLGAELGANNRIKEESLYVGKKVREEYKAKN